MMCTARDLPRKQAMIILRSWGLTDRTARMILSKAERKGSEATRAYRVNFYDGKFTVTKFENGDPG